MPYLACETALTWPVLALYRKKKHWLRLSHDPQSGEGKGCYYIDGSTHSASLGWGGTLADAQTAFTRALHGERTELTHVTGWRVPPLHASGTVMSAAEFRRAFAPGQRWQRRHYDGPQEVLTVKSVRSADLVFEGPRYLTFPKASRLRRRGLSIVVLDAEGKSQLTYTPDERV
jgi:hypothetical protein